MSRKSGNLEAFFVGLLFLKFECIIRPSKQEHSLSLQHISCIGYPLWLTYFFFFERTGSVGADKFITRAKVTILTANVQSLIKQCALVWSHLIRQSPHAPLGLNAE